ncbi:MAG: Fic family protein [Patescibacteria group bacterium]|nr:Fic family protein [Patescibacteria group bacterium]
MDIYGYNMDMIKTRLLNKINQLKEDLDKIRPVKGKDLLKLQEGLRIEWIYNSNAIEGNSLSLGETAFFLREGLTTEGRPLKDFLEAKNHQEAILAMNDCLKNKRSLSQSFIKELHAVLLKNIDYIWVRGKGGRLVRKKIEAGKYKTQPNHVLTLSGKVHYYTEPIKVQFEMDQLMNWYKNKGQGLEVVERATIFHYKLVKIHPFDDGNGRLARILMNLILIKDGFLPAVIKNDKRREYLKALESADKGNLSIFVNFTAFEVMETMEKVLMALKGEIKMDYIEFEVKPTAKDREKQILKQIKGGLKYGVADILRLVRIKRPTLKKDLARLVRKGRLKRTGKGKGTRYSLRRLSLQVNEP